MLKINTLKLVIYYTCVVSLQAHIFSFNFADHLLAIKTKMQGKFETITNTYEYLYKNLNRYTNDLKVLLEAASNHTEVEEFVSNPIYAFKLVKLLTIDFDKLRNKFTGKKALEFLSLIEEPLKSDNLTFPSIQDLYGICQAIIRLQDIYEMNEENILTGNLQNYWDGTLTESDLKELRRCYQYHKHFDMDKWLSSEIYYDDEPVEVLLLEYYKGFCGRCRWNLGFWVGCMSSVLLLPIIYRGLNSPEDVSCNQDEMTAPTQKPKYQHVIYLFFPISSENISIENKH